ncbi:hypothetical protein [Caulobacter sp. 17J65-9]|uniref:hypothetical protein n=1 Tax=Caulobacter sp. 17J65-9 TaxID=2709382 RepID=UPI0013C94C9A|nr:hypothetical protein [Caulobacter sp. 17J65-9]NEX92917.1 hypothetical protein [Caulobacter sp. 17J65-9]
MRLANLHEDGWRLASGEERHAETPDTFEIPPADVRHGLGRGVAAKLLFEIAFENEAGEQWEEVERMWVVVSEIVPDGYVGLLANTPTSIKGGGDVYLTHGAEIPFRPEHVVAVDRPDDAFLEEIFSQSLSRTWPRN